MEWLLTLENLWEYLSNNKKKNLHNRWFKEDLPVLPSVSVYFFDQKKINLSFEILKLTSVGLS